ncbi:MAG: ComEC/Rec2 family competence protein [Rhodobacteraceae bacterium]|nr:ComEC/Rec2 family competence protein [Paracoccaceae bacterium]
MFGNAWRRVAGIRERCGATVAGAIANQRGHLFVWAPVFFGLGIGAFFGLADEPGAGILGVAAGSLVALIFLGRRAGETAAPLLAAAALVAAGFLGGALRTHLVAAPVLDFRYYGPVEGRVIEVDRSISDALRLTLDRVVLLRVDPDRTPDRVRVSLHGEQGFLDPLPGEIVMMTGHLGPPGGPVEPYGFDFQRLAWFSGIGAVGYTRTPALALAPPAPGEPVAALNRFRMRVAAEVQRILPGQTGAFAAAVMTGDVSGLSRETLDAMRNSNLAHILSISGLHMALVTGFVFMTLRSAFALVPPLALRLPTKKLAAIVALAAAAGYLALSGGNVPTQRAFVMVAVMLVAVLLDLRALTLRAVALAALIVLAWMPEALMGPGFQMSFAATVALVWVFAGLREHRPDWLPRWLNGVFTLVVSSAVAGLATAPFAAAHFNQSASYGLIANLVAVPLVGSLVMPAAVFAACLAPFGLAGLGLVPMGWGIEGVLFVAHHVSALDGAVRYVKQPPPAVLPLLSLGLIWLMLWRGRLRFAGLAAAGLASVLWAGAERPEVLIAGNGALVGVMTPEGRALSRARGHGFIAQSWLENDGRSRDRDAASARGAAMMEDGALTADLGQVRVSALFSPDPSDLARACASAAVVVVNRAVDAVGPCLVLGPDALEQTGTIALSRDGTTVRVRSAAETAGRRLWNASDLRTGRHRPEGADRIEAQLRAALNPVNGAPAQVLAARQ